ncbi:hypothetical protein [Alkalisalibacterium limincola]|uniref:Uncharacterized protein n=1 Tax=Alkalisalibacterium limincola TaxID=2699169 RepID=A0A5C8KTG0_9GAMM|nr:hypothetical protein [Alkalisalibacterium limincola]TXK64306.1 hypothetical protein FU658_05220 [Alkalisalibacterium limincola]
MIDDASGAKVLDEIATRRAAAYRAEYDFFPDGESPDDSRRRFKWLHQEEALTDEQLQGRLAQVDAMEVAPTALEPAAARPLLN